MKAGTKVARRPQKKPVPSGYWKNPKNQKRMLMAMAERFALKSHEKPKQIAKEAGYAGHSHPYSFGRFRLSDLGKTQIAGTRGGFRVRRTAHERSALYKRVLQAIIMEPFKEYSAIAAELGMTHFALSKIITNMQEFGAMPPNFIITQRLKLIYKADTGNLPAKELASKLHINKVSVWKYRQRIKKIKEFAQKHNKPVERVLNRYGTLVKAGLLK